MKDCLLVRGTRIFSNFSLDNFISMLFKLCKKHGISRVFFPILTYKKTFENIIDNDLADKLWVLNDKKKRLLCLQPEYTMSTVMFEKYVPDNFFYLQKCFRYEKPQKFRYREFIQFGIEFNAKYSKLFIFFFKDLLCLINKFVEKKIILKYFNLSEKIIEQMKKIDVSKIFLCQTCILQKKKSARALLSCEKCGKLLLSLFKQEPITSSIFSQFNFSFLKKQIDRFLLRGAHYYNGLIWEAVLEGEQLSFLGGGFYLSQRNKKRVGLAIGIDRISAFLIKTKLIKIFLCKHEKDFVINLLEKICFFKIIDEINCNIRYEFFNGKYEKKSVIIDLVVEIREKKVCFFHKRNFYFFLFDSVNLVSLKEVLSRCLI